MSKIEKNLIFVTGNALGDYKKVAQELTWHLYKSVHLSQPCSTICTYQSPKDIATQNSLFFSQVLFYGSLPSRENIIIAIPDLTMKTILQIILLFENIKKNVFVVVDDRYLVSMISKDRYRLLLGKLPKGCGFFLSEIVVGNEPLFNTVEHLVDRLAFSSVRTSEETLKCFNDIYESIPELFREEIKKSIFGEEFGAVPFNKLVKNLLPDFNDTEGDEDVEKLKIPPKRTIPDYFETIKSTSSSDAPPPSLNIQEPEGEYISLFEDFTNPEHPFTERQPEETTPLKSN